MREQETLDPELAGKFDILCEALSNYGSIAVAFSGGVDSTLLLKVAHDVLGDDVLAITGKSASVPAREIEATRAFCEQEGIRHSIVETHEFEIEGFDHNPPDRCYHCKRELLTRLREEAAAHDIWIIAEGSNLDDEGDYRPGFRAVREMDVISPLRGAGFTKSDVRQLAKYLGLSVWDKPAFACLNTRFAFGDEITVERLALVDNAETYLASIGFPHVRVRVHDSAARIEVPESDIGRLVETDTRHMVAETLKSLGFSFVSVDMLGYRMGSMNETL